jgi:hypothetical protein
VGAEYGVGGFNRPYLEAPVGRTYISEQPVSGRAIWGQGANFPGISDSPEIVQNMKNVLEQAQFDKMQEPIPTFGSRGYLERISDRAALPSNFYDQPFDSYAGTTTPSSMITTGDPYPGATGVVPRNFAQERADYFRRMVKAGRPIPGVNIYQEIKKAEAEAGGN